MVIGIRFRVGFYIFVFVEGVDRVYLVRIFNKLLLNVEDGRNRGIDFIFLKGRYKYL